MFELRASEQAALIDADSGSVMSYRELAAQVDAHARRHTHRKLYLLRAHNSFSSVVELLGIWRAGAAVMLVDPALSVAREEALRAAYEFGRANVHEDLALLLSTSGTTGSATCVRLARSAVRANAAGIAHALSLHDQDRALLPLPIHYSYGLSVLTSHLCVGATTVLSTGSVLSESFWRGAREANATSMPGVPMMYQMVRRLNIDELAPPSLKQFTQAGGKLETSLIEKFAAIAASRGGSFTVMYGQTEATARLTVLPPAMLAAKLGSVGLPLRDSRIEISEDGEVIAYSPSVMMGTATTRADCERGDELHGRLATGDLGRLDEDGYLWITGRAKRIAKVFGVRVSLDEIEALLRGRAAVPPAVALAAGDKLIVVLQAEDPFDAGPIKKTLCEETGLPPAGIGIVFEKTLPMLSNGKIDLQQLAKKWAA